MADIITRETGPDSKDAPLTNAEVDNNFINLKTEAESKEEAGEAQDLLDAHEAAHPAPTDRDIRNEEEGVAATLDTAHTDAHPAPTDRDIRNEAEGVAATLDTALMTAHETPHPAPTNRDTRNEATGVAAALDTAHTDAHPAPTNRDTRNEAVGVAATLDTAHTDAHPIPTLRDTRNQIAGSYEDEGEAQNIMDVHETTHPIPTTRDTRNEAIGVAATLDTALMLAHESPHPAPTTRDARNEAVGVAAILDTAHTDAHPAPTIRDIRNEAIGVAATLDGNHTNNYTHSEIDHFNRASLETIEQSLATDAGVQFESLAIKHINFDVTVDLPVPDEGTIGYDKVNKCLALFNDQTAVTWQLGREVLMRVKNNTAGTLLNGRAVAVVGVSDVPEVDYATSFDETNENTVGILTQDIGTGLYGEVTTTGFVNGVDTSYLETEGAVVWLTDDFPATGLLTTTKPHSPSYATEMGGLLVKDAINGVLYSRMIPRGNREGLVDFYNGAILEDHTIDISSNGTDSVQLTLSNGSTFLSLLHHGEFHKHTIPDSVELNYGTDEAPVLNYVYIPESTELLTADVTIDFPVVEQITPIATVLVQSPANVAANGCYKVHAWTDHITDTVGQGHLSHINRWIRKQHATWVNGTLMSFLNSGTSNVTTAITTGQVLQLHQQEFPSIVTPAPFYVINDFTSPYAKYTNLAALTLDSLGVTLSNRAFSIVFWGVINEDTGDCKIMMNRPSGSYAQSKPEEAAADIQKFTNYSVPDEYRGVGFLLRRLVCSFNVGGTLLTLYEGTYDGDDLRGQTPGTTAGGGGFGAGGNLPIAGATDQHLVKQSAIDYDAIWQDLLVSTDDTLTGVGTSGDPLSVDLEGTYAQELTIVPRTVYFVYGGSGDGGATPDATTQVSIDALTTLNVPIENIRWIYTA